MQAEMLSVDASALWSANWAVFALGLLSLGFWRFESLFASKRWAYAMLQSALALSACILWMPPWAPFHFHDYLHYKTQESYMAELGYFEAYKCQSAALPADQRPKARRDLRSYQLEPGYSEGDLEHCQKLLGPKMDEFSKLTNLILGSVDQAGREQYFFDRGFNGSSFWVALNRLGGGNVDVSKPGGKEALWAFDFFWLALAVGSLMWASGWGRGAAAACLMMSHPMMHSSWVSISLGRFDWLGIGCLGLALMSKGGSKSRLVGAAFAGAAGALRILPLAYALLALGLVAAAAALRERALPRGWGAPAAAAMLSFAACLAFGDALSGRLDSLVWLEKLAVHKEAFSVNLLGALPLANSFVLMSGFHGLAGLGVWGWIPLAALAAALLWRLAVAGGHEVGGRSFLWAASFGLWIPPSISGYYFMHGLLLAGAGSSWAGLAAGFLLQGALGALLSALPAAMNLIVLASAFSSLQIYIWMLGSTLAWRQKS